MAQFGASIQTAQVTTGNFQTTVDAYVSGYAGYPNNPGERNPLGAAYYDSTGSNSNPWGVPGKYRYVRYNSTSNPAITTITGPFVVYWTDATFTTVSPVSSEAVFNGANAVAGIAMPNVTALSTLTATILNGNYIWICVGGYITNVWAPASTATGDILIGTSGTNFALTRIAAGSNITARPVAVAYSAVATNLANMLVVLES